MMADASTLSRLAPPRPCELCGVSFRARKTQAAKGQGRFCSVQCAAAARMVCDEIKFVTQRCAHCASLFRVHPTLIKRGGGLYCSKRCANTVNTTLRNLETARPLADRFWEKVDRSGGKDACWPWMAGGGASGHGHFRIGRHVEKAPRVALALTLGLDLRDGWWACHDCDSPPCCNPKHLFVGDAQANTADMVGKGRQARGERCGRAVLNASKVLEIRAATESQKDLARRFGVSVGCISHVRLRLTWAHIP